MIVLSPLLLLPRILAIMLTTFAALTHGAPSTSPITSPGIWLAPSAHCGLVLVLTTPTLLALTYADEQRLPLPSVTIHVYDPADYFHTADTVNQPHPSFESDQSHLVYGDSDTEGGQAKS